MNKFFSIWIVSTILFSACPVIAQTNFGLIPRQLLFEEAANSQVTLSKDGQSVFFKKAGQPSSVYFATVEEPNSHKSALFSGKVQSFFPAYENAGIFAAIQTEKGLEIEYATWPIGNKSNITPFELESIRFLKSSSIVKGKIACLIVAKDPANNGLYLVDAKGTGTKRIFGDFDLVDVALDEMLNVKVWSSIDQDGHLIVHAPDEYGDILEVYKSPSSDRSNGYNYTRLLGVNKDASKAYLMQNADRDRAALFAIDLKTGKPLLQAEDDHIDLMPEEVVFNVDGNPIMAMGWSGSVKRKYVDPAAKDHFAFLKDQLKSEVSVAQVSKDGRYWLVTNINGKPNDYYRYDTKEKGIAFVISERPALNDYVFTDYASFEVTMRDGKKFPVQAYLPTNTDRNQDGKPDQAYPTIIYVHDYLQDQASHWNAWEDTRVLQLLANRRYVVLHVDFRGAMGYGKYMAEQGKQQWGLAMQNDLEDVAKWAVEQGFAREGMMGVVGKGYGGYAAAEILATKPNLFSCGLMIGGATDLVAYGKMPEQDNPRFQAMVGNAFDEDGAVALKAISPIQNVSKITKPLCMVYGGSNKTVVDEQGLAFAKALSVIQSESICMTYPNEPTLIKSSEANISFWALGERFLSQFLRGKYEPNGAVDASLGTYDMPYGKKWMEKLD